MQSTEGFLIVNIYALLMIAITSIVFFHKPRQMKIEDKTYAILLFITDCVSIIGIFLGVIVHPNLGINNDIICFINKIYLISLFLWIIILTFYILCISVIKEEKYIMLKKIFTSVIALSIILILILPINVDNGLNGATSSGPAIVYTWLISGLGFIVQIICVILDRKHMKSKKYAPLYMLIFLGITLLILQIVFPNLNYLVNPVIVIITYIMYHTIENPDVRLANELILANELLAKEKDYTANSLNTLSSSIDKTLTKLIEFGNRKFDNDNEFDRERDDIQEYSIKLANEVKGIIELSKIESGKYPLKNYRYDTKELMEEVKDLFDIKTGNDKIEISYDFDNDIHPVLSGDDEKIKETLISLYNVITSNFSVNKLTLKLDVRELGIACRLRFSMIICNINKLDNPEDKLSGLDYDILKKLIDLQKIKFLVDSKDNNIEFMLTINQRIEKDYKIDDIKKVNRKVSYFDLSNKNVLIVDDNKNKVNNLILLFEPYHANISVAYDYVEFTNLLYGDNYYDLVLIDDMMPDTSEFYYLNSELIGNVDMNNKIKRMAGYNPRVVVMLTVGNKLESKYKELKLDYILKPMDINKLNKILKKYFK